MPEHTAIVDAGPLVALLVADDQYHHWACEQFAHLAAPLLTCEPVLTETAFLTQRVPGGTARFCELLERRLLQISLRAFDELPAISELMRKYQNVPMSLADACLVRMAELHPHTPVLTTDAHFSIYRLNGRKAVPLIAPARPTAK